MSRALHVQITGRVQGVGFRAFTRDRALAHGVGGWVRNLADGRVEARLEGSPDALEALLADLARGPRFGRVDEIARETVPDEGHTGFEIRR